MPGKEHKTLVFLQLDRQEHWDWVDYTEVFTCDLWKNKRSNVEQTEDGPKRKKTKYSSKKRN